MKELFIYAEPKYGGVLKETEIPKPGPKEVLIKVAFAGLNPKDWKATRGLTESEAFNTGDDVAGIIEAVGSEVFEFKKGDRVAGFHRMRHPHGTFAEYTVVNASTTFHLPPNISFQSGAALPLAFMTAAIALYQCLKLPLPTTLQDPAAGKTPILIWGGATAVGAFALQLAKLSNLGPIITVAGNGIDFVKSLNAADHIIDYREGDVVQKIIDAAGPSKIKIAFDSVSDSVSYEPISKVLVASGGGEINMVDPVKPGWTFPESVKLSRTMVGSSHGDTWGFINEDQAQVDQDFAYWFYRYLSHLLAEGKFKPHPVEVLPDGLNSVVAGIQALYDRKVSARKLVARIGNDL
ncbi:GroES-like protein [Trichoderma pleuroticola]